MMIPQKLFVLEGILKLGAVDAQSRGLANEKEIDRASVAGGGEAGLVLPPFCCIG